ncbi:MAG: DNA alkylation repair protein [Acidimicrobiales bacterium]
MTVWSSDVVRRVAERFEAARDPEAAGPMAAYMRHQFAFLGISTKRREAMLREVVAGRPAPDERDLIDLTLALWDRDEREYQYAALWILRRRQRVLTPDFVPTAEHAITTRSWWDSVDTLAQHIVGGIVRRHRDLESLMAEWLVSDDIWLARSSILHQERWKADTDPDVLFAACLARAADKEFFLRKAIGWALRSYSYVDPVAVELFVRDHDAELSGLSKREAMKAIERQRQPSAPSPR